MHAQQIPGGGHAGAPPMLGMPHPSLAPGALGLASLGNGTAPHSLSMMNKPELHRPEESKSASGISVPDERHVSTHFT